MDKRLFYIVDVFAEEKYAGNQLAVYRNCSDFSTEMMQTIAREMNYSETTFILSEDKVDNGYDVRIFTPAEELPFAGHPTLGTAFVIQQAILKKQIQHVNLNLEVGQIPVAMSYKNDQPDKLWMRQIPPIFGPIHKTEPLAEILNVSTDDIDSRFPVQEVSTGVFTFIVPLKTHRALKRARVNPEKLFEYIKNTDSKTILIFCPETYGRENRLSVRFFADDLGVVEDPATGSANGCLAGYLVHHRYFNSKEIDIRVEQGYEIKRPSILMLKAAETTGSIEVNVGGRAIMVAKGELV